jgi:hypothetical protein
MNGNALFVLIKIPSRSEGGKNMKKKVQIWIDKRTSKIFGVFDSIQQLEEHLRLFYTKTKNGILSHPTLTRRKTQIKFIDRSQALKFINSMYNNVDPFNPIVWRMV